MNTIDEHIAKDQVEIEAAKAAGDQGKVRHLEEELKGLQEFKAHHPEDSHDPSPLEVYCDMNPEAPSAASTTTDPSARLRSLSPAGFPPPASPRHPSCSRSDPQFPPHARQQLIQVA